MSVIIIKQANGLYAEYYTILGIFKRTDMTEEDLIESYAEQAAHEARMRCTAEIERLKRGEGRMSWEDAVENHNFNHPEDTITK